MFHQQPISQMHRLLANPLVTLESEVFPILFYISCRSKVMILVVLSASFFLADVPDILQWMLGTNTYVTLPFPYVETCNLVENVSPATDQLEIRA
eukprot:462506-Pelagomonas_calceolata.AAC.1